jgi:hypothetical protein
MKQAVNELRAAVTALKGAVDRIKNSTPNRIIEYYICLNIYESELIKEVNLMIGQGLEPTGSISTVFDKNNYFFYQPIVLRGK